MHPRDQLGEARARVGLRAQGLGVLGLAARAAQVHHQVTRDAHRGRVAEVVLDQREREVDAGRHARRGVVAAGLDEQRVGVEADGRVGARHLGRVLPVRRGATAVEQAARGERVDAGAHRDHAPAARGVLPQPRRDARQRARPAQPGAARYDDRVQRAGARERGVREQPEPRLGGERAGADAEDAAAVTRRAVAIACRGERVQRADQVQRHDVGERHDPDRAHGRPCAPLPLSPARASSHRSGTPCSRPWPARSPCRSARRPRAARGRCPT